MKHGASLVALLLACGCIWETDKRGKVDLGVQPAAAAWADSAAHKGTIGALTYVNGLAPLRVQGYGLVVGLGNNGSRQCPRKIREPLLQDLHKHYQFSSRVVGVESLKPEQLLNDIDTAVVVVRGAIPGGAVVGTTFDVTVSVLPGTQTKSLRGGRLFTTELAIVRWTPAGTSITGRVLAKASGPVFLNPFSDDQSATKSNPLEGVVLGGGRTRKARDLRLVLIEPSHAWARRIQDRINNRFPDRRKVADAISPSFVEIRVPDEYRAETAHGIALIQSLYLSHDPVFEAMRANVLAREILKPTAPHALISLCLEGLGRAALPVLPDLYTHPQGYVSFHAAVAGVRLGEHVAADAAAQHAEDPDSRYRFQAIRALGEAKRMGGAVFAMRRLLEDEDPRVRIAAYEALVQHANPTIRSTRIAGDNFHLDMVPSEQSNIVYARRTGARRIALFGEGLRVQPPVHYVAPDGSLTINAYPDDDRLTLMRVAVATGARSDPILVPLELEGLIRILGHDAEIDADGEALGLGLDYGAVVRAIYFLCRDGCINAKFMLEQPNAAELFGPARPESRPESEL